MHGTNKTRKGLIQHFKQVEENMAIIYVYFFGFVFFDAFIINSCYININFHCKPTKPIERMYIAVAYYVHIYYNYCTGGKRYESQYYRIKKTS